MVLAVLNRLASSIAAYAVTVFCMYSSLACAQPAPHLYLIPQPPDRSGFRLTAIANRGAAGTGYGSLPSDNLRIVGSRWTPETGVIDLPILPPEQVMPWAISADGGVVAGAFYPQPPDTFAENFRAFRSGPDGQIEDLGVLPTYARSTVRAANHDGTVLAGYNSLSNGASEQRNPFRWTRGTGMVSLGHLRPQNTYTNFFDMSTNGQFIVGYSGRNPISALEPYIWSQATGMVPLTIAGSLGASFGEARGVNADGTVVVGQVRDGATGVDYACRWVNGQLTYLPTMPGYRTPYATGVDDSGSIVIMTAIPLESGVTNRSFVWTPETGTVFATDFFAMHGVNLPFPIRDILSMSPDGTAFTGYGAGQIFVVTIPGPGLSLLPLSFLYLSVRRRRRN